MSNTLTKADIAEKIRMENAFTQLQAAELVEIMLQAMKTSLAAGEDVMITGFGKFQVRSKTARIGRNPSTGEPKIITARKVVTFKCSGKLKEKVNGR